LEHTELGAVLAEANLMRLARTRPLTIDDLPEQDEPGRAELIDGSLYVTPLGDLEHQRIAFALAVALQSAVPAGLEVFAGVNVVEHDQTIVIPDVAVVDPLQAVRNGLGVSPKGVVLVVEVTSPSTRRTDLTAKRDLYEEWGVPYLVIDRRRTGTARSVFGTLPDWASSIG
jgi:Uma2 family endonuclease